MESTLSQSVASSNAPLFVPTLLVEIERPLYHPYSMIKHKPEILHRGPFGFLHHFDALYFTLGEMGRLHPVRSCDHVDLYATLTADRSVLSRASPLPTGPVSEHVLQGVLFDAIICASTHSLDLSRVVSEGIARNQDLYNDILSYFTSHHLLIPRD